LYDRKCRKFVNCHDARDGRVDGRGPNRQTGFWRDGVFVPRGERTRNRTYANSDYRNRRTTWAAAQRRASLRRNR
jgi:hypothetical protein